MDRDASWLVARPVGKLKSMSEFFYPKLTAVETLIPYKLRTTWSTGEVFDVDVASVLRKVVAFERLLEPKIFRKVRLGDFGRSIEWFDNELGVDNVYAWAKEQAGEVSHEMFGVWMHRNGLSLALAAQALGISRRMVSYYRTAHKPIPRSIWLACLGWEATRPGNKKLPRGLPSPKQYALNRAT